MLIERNAGALFEDSPTSHGSSTIFRGPHLYLQFLTDIQAPAGIDSYNYIRPQAQRRGCDTAPFFQRMREKVILASRLLGPPVSTSEMDPSAADGRLLRDEERAVARAVEKRRREFLAGRTCARRAIAALGAPSAAILQGVDRVPIWPEGLVGSITHTDGWCAVAVARISDGFRAIGIDVEAAVPMDVALLRIICGPEERALIEVQPVEHHGYLGKLVFSAKESAYKCQYAISRTVLGYHDLSIRLDIPARRFIASFRRVAGPFVPGDELGGSLLVDQGYIMTAATLTTQAAYPRAQALADS